MYCSSCTEISALRIRLGCQLGRLVKRADEQFSAHANSNKESQQADHITSAEWPTRGLHTAGRAAAAP